jgi:hypothetical protein
MDHPDPNGGDFIVSSFLLLLGGFVYACYDAIDVLGRGLPVADADSHGATWWRAAVRGACNDGSF